MISPPPGAVPLGTAPTLAALLDLQGSVHLAHCLQGAMPKPDRSPWGVRPGGAPMLLGDYLRRRLEVLDRPGPPRGAMKPPPLEDVHARLVSVDVKSAEQRRAAAGTIARWYRDHALVVLGRGRADVDALREEVIDDVRALGGPAARLEALDAALRSGTRAAVAGLFERLATALEGALAPQIAAALAELASAPKLADVERWHAPQGPIGAHLARLQYVARTLVRRDAAKLVALVDAACKEDS